MFSCLVVALLGVALLAGCGGGSNSTSSTATTATGSQSREVTGGKTSSGTAAAHPLTPKQRVEVCKRIIQAPSTLSASTKAKLEQTCEKAAASTSTTAEREIIREACSALASRAPAGVARERALAVCGRAP
jgi:hypothetical protein